MAISKILHMKDCGGHFHGKHLKSSLDYIMNPEKTQNGRLIGGINCQPDTAFEQMKETKRKFGKIDKRQGYHLILSFKEDEADPDTAFEITQKFVAEYLAKDYEVVFVVHDNTENVHSHIVFNSVSFVDGKKYRYKKGDWAKTIQPITNRLCEEYGLSVIDMEESGKDKSSAHYKEWNKYHDGEFVWNDMIRRDVDACILQATTLDDFLRLLEEKGYQIKRGKHTTVKPPGMKRARRLDTLGDDYSAEQIMQRIKEEDLSYYQSQKEEVRPQIVKCYIKRYRRAKMSGLQKRYYARLYQTGQLKKKPYSQVWKYKDDIRKMEKLQQQYLFLARHDIHNVAELAFTVQNLTDKKKEAAVEKSRVYKAKARCNILFDIHAKLTEIEPAEKSYQNGDFFFREEHNQWISFVKQLREEGYTVEEVEQLQCLYQEQIAQVGAKEKAIFCELNLGKSIWKEVYSENDAGTRKKEEINKEASKDKDVRKQPVR